MGPLSGGCTAVPVCCCLARGLEALPLELVALSCSRCLNRMRQTQTTGIPESFQTRVGSGSGRGDECVNSFSLGWKNAQRLRVVAIRWFPPGGDRTRMRCLSLPSVTAAVGRVRGVVGSPSRVNHSTTASTNTAQEQGRSIKASKSESY